MFEGNQCVTYCPPGESLDLNQGRCISDTSVAPELKQCAGNPVSINDGEKVQVEAPDLFINTSFPLAFQRTYRSYGGLVPRSQHNELLYSNAIDKTNWTRYVQPGDYTGPKTSWLVAKPITQQVNGVAVVGQRQWVGNFDYFLNVQDSGLVLVSRPNEPSVTFQNQSGSYQPTSLSAASLTHSGTGNFAWTFRDVDNSQYLFADSGLLTRIINPAGLSQWLSYDADSRLASVRDDFGNQLTFTHANGFLTSVTASSGDAVAYEYDPVGNLIKMTRTPATGPTSVRQYHYEDSRFPYALTGITDEKGVLYASWTYDDVGRAIESVHAGEQDKTTFAFTQDNTTVTNPLGKADVYHYATVGGARRLVSVEGQASTSCLASNQAYSYYANGLLQTKTDQQGHVTQYEYNDRGLVTKMVEAAGTPQERITTTQWHPTLPLPIKVTQGNRVVSYSYDGQERLISRQVGN